MYSKPLPYICVDEGMVSYNRSFCGFKQYLPTKSIFHGLKFFVLACSESKFILNYEVYVGVEK